jgi:hypothetical protein
MSVVSKINYFIYSQFWPGKLNVINHARYPGIDGRIIFKWLLKINRCRLDSSGPESSSHSSNILSIFFGKKLESLESMFSGKSTVFRQYLNGFILTA